MTEDRNLPPDRILSDRIIALFEEYDMPTIGMSLAFVFSAYTAKSELESENGDRILAAMLGAFQRMGEASIDKIKELRESSPETLKDLLVRVTQQYH